MNLIYINYNCILLWVWMYRVYLVWKRHNKAYTERMMIYWMILIIGFGDWVRIYDALSSFTSVYLTQHKTLSPLLLSKQSWLWSIPLFRWVVSLELMVAQNLILKLDNELKRFQNPIIKYEIDISYSGVITNQNDIYNYLKQFYILISITANIPFYIVQYCQDYC